MRKQSEADRMLEEEIVSILRKMSYIEPDAQEYEKLTARLETLRGIQDVKSERKLKPDTVALVAANILGIVIILGFEQANVITSKALGFVTKGRV